MQTLQNIKERLITEKFQNLFHKDEKEQHSEAVWDMLQKSYAKIGGIKGSGFESAKAMTEKIPFWKIAFKNGVPKAVVMYKDKGGRKTVAMGTDGTPEGLKLFKSILREDMNRSWGEYSKALLSIIMKLVSWSELKKYVVDPKSIKDAVPIGADELTKLDARQKQVLAKYPQLKKWGYFREIGGEVLFKVAFGTMNKRIEL
tara:strand:+ start:37 stop:639 length:603 start_codon:yes stop_codon:yes gene_type:complete